VKLNSRSVQCRTVVTVSVYIVAKALCSAKLRKSGA